MSSKKIKNVGGSGADVGAVREGATVRVLYDDMGWFHGDIEQVGVFVMDEYRIQDLPYQQV